MTTRPFRQVQARPWETAIELALPERTMAQVKQLATRHGVPWRSELREAIGRGIALRVSEFDAERQQRRSLGLNV
jgi:hypothetical protein